MIPQLSLLCVMAPRFSCTKLPIHIYLGRQIRVVNGPSAHRTWYKRRRFQGATPYLKWRALLLRGSAQRPSCLIILDRGVYCPFVRLLLENFKRFRFPAPRNPRDFARLNIMNDIERHANDAWKSGMRCIAAYDFLRVDVPMALPTGPSFLSRVDNPGPQEQEQQLAGPVNESDPERGEGRKRRRSMGSVDNPVAEGLEARNSENARGGRGWSHSRSGYPNTRGRGFYRNAGHSRGNGGMRRPF